MSRRLIPIALALLAATPVLAHPGLEARLDEIARRMAQRPGSAALLTERARVHEEHGDVEPARADLARACALEPGLPEPWLALAQLELRALRPAEALAAADAFLAARPDDAAGLLARARALQALGDPAARPAWVAAMDAAERAGPGTPELYLDASRSLGPPALDRGIARLGRIPTLVGAAIEAEVEAGRTLAAIARCREASAADPGWTASEWRVREGEILVLAGRPSEARAALDRALRELERLPPRPRASSLARQLVARAQAALEGLGP